MKSVSGIAHVLARAWKRHAATTLPLIGSTALAYLVCRVVEHTR
jgi:hypothetical protein